jgi:excinuclease ABC subunit A
VRWEGRILESIVDRAQALGGRGLSPAEWSQRGVVRISGTDQTRIQFPFFHATTSSEWVITLRFFVPRNTFRAETLESRLKLVPFHRSEPPVLCDLPRLRVEALGPFQAITIIGHAAGDVETPAFDAFLRKAVSAFLKAGQQPKLMKASDLSG